MPEAHEPVPAHPVAELTDDEKHLAKLGYSQELSRSWSSFSNFAISFSIISILAGCFTTFGQAWNNGGPIAISWGWPIISAFILLIGFTLSELVSAYPTSGGIYWWAAKLGGPAAGFFTGWLNLIGLLAVTASVAYGAATFLDLTISTISTSWADGYSLTRVFLLFVAILVAASLLNIFSGHLLAVITEHINNSGFGGGTSSGKIYWFLVLPLGFLLTQYTITGFDASAHLSEETQGAAEGAAKGIWRSIFYSAVGGYILLLAFVFAVQDPQGVSDGFGAVDVIFGQALPEGWHFLILLISTAGQLFCTTACLTSASRMTFAFSRDGAIPGSGWLSTVNAKTKIPANAVAFVAVIGILITLPALKSIGGVPVAFYAVVSVAVIGLYLSFLIPIFLRWRIGDDFEAGSWTNGAKYKWMNPIAVAEIAIISVYFILPFTPAGVPFSDEFAWSSVNYAPVLTIGTLLVLAIWWNVSAKKWFTGPKNTIDKDVVEAFDD